MKRKGQILIKQTPHNLSELYDKYAGMLLGYIFEIVKDSAAAERHLVTIYSNAQARLNHLYADGENVWCSLQRFAKEHLDNVADGVKHDGKASATGIVNNTGNKFLDLMTTEQKQIFCGVYYHRKSIACIAAELNKTEDSTRKTLKEAFVLIKKA